MQSLVEIGPVVLEKKIFKYFQYNFTFSLLSPLRKRQIWLKLANGSGKEVENVKSLLTDRQTTDNRRSEKLT